MGLLGSISGNKSYGAGLLGNLASSGRNGDTRMAHVTPGEVVVPKEVAALRPDIVAHIAAQIKKMGGNPKGSVVGRGRINPKTGIEEFATEAEVRQAYKSIAGKEPDAAGLAYWMNPTSNFSTSTFQNSVDEYNKNNPSPATSTPSKDAITSAYKDIAGKEPDAEGMAYWSDPKNNFSIDTFKDSVLDYYKNNPAPPAPTVPIVSPDDAGKEAVDTAKDTVDKLKSPIDINKETKGLLDDLNKSISNIPTPAPVEYTPYAPITHQITPEETTSYQVGKLLDENGAFIQQARTQGLQAGASRGFLNSSMAVGAAQDAAIGRAGAIGESTANAYLQTAANNLSAQNTAAANNAKAQLDTALANGQISQAQYQQKVAAVVDAFKLQQAQIYDQATAQNTFAYDFASNQGNISLTSTAKQWEAAQNFGYEKELRSMIEEGATQRTKIEADLKYAQLSQDQIASFMTSTESARLSYETDILAIAADPDLDPDMKEALMDFKKSGYFAYLDSAKALIPGVDIDLAGWKTSNDEVKDPAVVKQAQDAVDTLVTETSKWTDEQHAAFGDKIKQRAGTDPGFAEGLSDLGVDVAGTTSVGLSKDGIKAAAEYGVVGLVGLATAGIPGALSSMATKAVKDVVSWGLDALGYSADDSGAVSGGATSHDDGGVTDGPGFGGTASETAASEMGRASGDSGNAWGGGDVGGGSSDGGGGMGVGDSGGSPGDAGSAGEGPGL